MAKLPERDLEIFWNRLEDVYEYFKSRGISDEIAAALLGNIARESSGLWDAIKEVKNKKTGKIDIYRGGVMNEQLTYDWVFKWYKGYNKKHQITYLADGILGTLPDIKSERGRLLEGRFNRFRNVAKRTRNVSELAKAWEEIYEISGNSLLDERQQCAEYFYKQMQKKKQKQSTNYSSKPSNRLSRPKSSIQNLIPDFSKPPEPIKNPFFNFYSSQPDDAPVYPIKEIKSDFDIPLMASSFKNGGKLIKKHQYGGTLASKYILTYTNPDNPLITYVNLEDAEKAGLLYTNDPQDEHSGAWFGPGISEKKEGRTENGIILKNNIGGQWVNPKTTFVAVDPYNRIINNENFDVVLNAQNLVPTTGYVYDEKSGWVKLPDTYSGEILDRDMLDKAEQAARFLSDRGFEHAWRMSPEARIQLATDVQKSDAAGYATVFGAQIPGATASAYNWLTETNVGRSLTSSLLAAEGFNQTARGLGYEDYGTAMSAHFGGNPFWWNLANPGYLFGGNLVKPLADELTPVVKEVTTSLTNRLLSAAEKLNLGEGVKAGIYYVDRGANQLRNFYFKDQQALQSSTENNIILDWKNHSPEERRARLVEVQQKAPINTVRTYSPEDAEEVNRKLVVWGYKGSNADPNEQMNFMGDITLDTPSQRIKANLKKYRIENLYEPTDENMKLSSNSSVDYEIPLTTYIVKTNDGLVDLKQTRRLFQLVDDFRKIPSFVVHWPKHEEEFPLSAGVHRIFNGRQTSFITKGIASNFQEIFNTGVHETSGHGMNPYTRLFRLKAANTTLYDLIASIYKSPNPKISQILYKKGNLNYQEVQAMLDELDVYLYRGICKRNNITMEQYESLSHTNPQKAQALLEQYVDDLSPEETAALLRRLDSEYASLIYPLLPGKQGLAEMLEARYAGRPYPSIPNTSYKQALDEIVSKGLTYTKQDAEEELTRVKTFLKYGFSFGATAAAANKTQ